MRKLENKVAVITGTSKGIGEGIAIYLQNLEDFMDAEDETVRDLHFDINIKGTWNAVKAVLPEMIRKETGKIVVMSSVTGNLVAMHHINVNAICPGYVRTPLVEGMARQSDPDDPERAIQAIADAVPLGRLAAPEEIGELAAFLNCEESSYITGTQIVIDGGSTLPETSSMGQ